MTERGIGLYLWLVMNLPVVSRVVGREKGIRFYLRSVVKEESDFTTCGWSRNRNQILPVTGRERGTRLYLCLVVKGESDFYL